MSTVDWIAAIAYVCLGAVGGFSLAAYRYSAREQAIRSEMDGIREEFATLSRLIAAAAALRDQR